MKINKLVRDKIAILLKQKGWDCKIKRLESHAYKTALINKLQEEVNEFIQAHKRSQRVEELADILEVIHTILKEQRIPFSEVESLRYEKRQQKGGFNQKIFLEKCTPYEKKSCCPFCLEDESVKNRVVAEFTHCFVIKDGFPVSKGHLLIIPYQHFTHWFETPLEVRLEIIDVLDKMKSKLDSQYTPEGYNIGMNCGKVAGQTVMHLHVHLIPRYRGDMKAPQGGVRGVIPEKQKY